MMNWIFSDSPRFKSLQDFRLILEDNVELKIFEGGHSPYEILLTEEDRPLDIILRENFRIVNSQNDKTNSDQDERVRLGRLRITIERA